MDLGMYQAEKDLKSKDIISAVQEKFPKYDKFIHSKVLRPAEYGIGLIKEAQKLVEDIAQETAQKPRRKENRKNPYRLTFRANKKLLGQLQLAQKRIGIETMQDFLTYVVISWMERENGTDT